MKSNTSAINFALAQWYKSLCLALSQKVGLTVVQNKTSYLQAGLLAAGQMQVSIKYFSGNQSSLYSLPCHIATINFVTISLTC